MRPNYAGRWSQSGGGGYQRRTHERPIPPANRLMSHTSATIAATMKSQWTAKPAPKAAIARIARTSNNSMLVERRGGAGGYAGRGVSTRIASPVCAWENPNLYTRGSVTESMTCTSRAGIA